MCRLGRIASCGGFSLDDTIAEEKERGILRGAAHRRAAHTGGRAGLGVTRCWRVPDAGGAGRKLERAPGVVLASDSAAARRRPLSTVVALQAAPARRRAGGAGRPAAGGGRGRRRAGSAGGDQDPAAERCWRVPGADSCHTVGRRVMWSSWTQQRNRL